jgi:hypothetical protein
MGEICSKHVQVSVRKPVGQEILLRPRSRWEYNNKMVLQRVGRGRGLKLSASGQAQVLAFVNVISEIRVLYTPGIS